MKSDMGHKEWLDEYPALKQVAEKQAFTVPNGYFSELENKITSAIKLEELKSEKGFTVPKNYFDELNSNIQSRINIEEFVNNTATGHITPVDYFEELSGNIEGRITISEFETGKGLTVPENYFDELSSNIQSRINIGEFEEGKGLTVPDNYFDELSSNIQSRINIDAFVNTEVPGHAVPDYFMNLENQITSRIFVEETLNKNEEEFVVPAGYFESLNKAILDKTTKQEKEERRSLVRKMFAYNAVKYAAAACLALVIGTGVLIGNLTNPRIAADHDHTFLHKQLSSVSTGDIQTYLQDEVDPSETQHIVVDEDAPANDDNLNSALQSIATSKN